MCSIILRIGEAGVWIGANRDEMLARAWDKPAEFWPGIIAGRDRLGGGTWLGLNRHGVVAAVLNRTGTLGPAAGKRSRGELPLLALEHAGAREAVAALGTLDCEQYRSFNLVVADADVGFLLRGLEAGGPDVATLQAGVTMITSGEPNDVAMPRIARHLPKFEAAGFEDWGPLLADESGAWETALNIPARNGFGTVCSSLIALPKGDRPEWWFADTGFSFAEVPLWR
jgi:hypothetical protein